MHLIMGSENISDTHDILKGIVAGTNLNVYGGMFAISSTNASDGIVTYSVVSFHDLLFYLLVLPFIFLPLWTIRFLRQSVRTIDRIATSQCVVLILGVPLVPVFAIVRNQITDIKTGYYYCQTVNFVQTVLGVYLVTSCFSIALIRYFYTVHALKTRQWNLNTTYKICLFLSLGFASLRGAQRLLWPGRLFRMCFGFEIHIKDLSVSWVPFLYGGTILPYIIIFVYTQIKKNRYVCYQNMSLISVGGNIAVYVIQAAVSLVLQHLYRVSDISTFAPTDIMKNDLIYFMGSLAMSILVPLAYIIFSVRVREEAFKDVRTLITFLLNSCRLIEKLWTPSSRSNSPGERIKPTAHALEDIQSGDDLDIEADVSKDELRVCSDSPSFRPTSSSLLPVTSGPPAISCISTTVSSCHSVGSFDLSSVYSTITSVPNLPSVVSSSPVKSSVHLPSFPTCVSLSTTMSNTPLSSIRVSASSCSSSICPRTEFSHLLVSPSSSAASHTPQTVTSDILFVSPYSATFSDAPPTSNTPVTTVSKSHPCSEEAEE